MPTPNIILTTLINLIRQHIDFSGCISLITLGLAKFFTVLGIILQFSFGIIGATVGLITIYTFAEKKGFLPLWLVRNDRISKLKD